jgi:hypothetical protein
LKKHQIALQLASINLQRNSLAITKDDFRFDDVFCANRIDPEVGAL